MPARGDADPFGTGRLRAAVLQTWAASPERFREDANAEELLTQGYADRVLVELVANAVDAAGEAGVPAHVRISLHRTASGAELRVANTGAPLTATGVRALASLRASAKRDDPGGIGRFGVGFTAVRALTDAPQVLSRSGGVAFSADRTAQAVAGLPGEVRAELDRRDGVLPALRLCWPADAAADDPVPDGFTTEVRLPLRPGTDGDAVLRDWSAIATDQLWWALPGLAGIDLPGGRLRRTTAPVTGTGGDTAAGRDGADPTAAPDAPGQVVVLTAHRDDGAVDERRYRVVERTGELPAGLLAGSPVEERDRRGWRICWSLPLSGSDDPTGEPADPFAAVSDPEPHPVGAPTPTDTLLSLPARLVGTFGVDETRRHLLDDERTRYLLDRAVEAYLELVELLPPAQRWDLVPPTGFGAGSVDATVREGVLRHWRDRPLLRSPLGDPVQPADAVTVEGVGGDTLAALAEALPGLVEVPADRRRAARVLGVRTAGIADALDAAAGLQRPPAWWGRLHRGLRGLPAEALTGVPVPLADGRQVVGARGVLVPDDTLGALLPRLAAVLPALRWAHPEADAELLLRCGAERADPSAILRSAAVADAVAGVRDDLDADLLDHVVPPDPAAGPDGTDGPDAFDGPDERAAALAALLLDLLAAGGGPAPVGVVLSTDDDEPWPADDLLLPGTAYAAVLDPDALPAVGARWREGWDDAVLAAAGVRDRPLLVDVDDPRADDLLPDLDDWRGTTSAPPDARGIADLDLVVDWPGLWSIVAGDPALLEAVTVPADGTSYSAWWMARWARVDGLPTAVLRPAGAVPGSSPLTLLTPLPVVLPRALTDAIGAVADEDAASAALHRDPGPLLAAFCDETRELPPAAVAWWGERLVDALAARRDGPADDGEPDDELPDGVRASDGRVHDPDDVVVPDGPWWAQLRPPGALLALDRPAASTAAAFDLEVALAGDLEVTGGDPVPAAVPPELVGDAAALPVVVDGLTVTGDGVAPTRVAWWPVAGGIACDGSDVGLSRALAWSTGRWRQRHALLAALRGEADTGSVEAAWDR